LANGNTGAKIRQQVAGVEADENYELKYLEISNNPRRTISNRIKSFAWKESAVGEGQDTVGFFGRGTPLFPLWFRR